MSTARSTPSLSALLRGSAAQPEVRLLLSLIAAAVCSACALLSAWLWALVHPGVSFVLGTSSAPALPFLHVDGHTLAASFLLWAIVWLLSLWWIWSFNHKARPFVAAALTTAGLILLPMLASAAAHAARLGRTIENGAAWTLGVVSLLAAVAIWSLVWRRRDRRPGPRDTRGVLKPLLLSILVAGLTLAAAFGVRAARLDEAQLLILAALLVGVAGVLAIWLPLAIRIHTSAIVGPEDIVNVRCPQCGYSLVGLTELRCPECGTRFTIDELIRAQGYNADA
jgi:hypothetical protein